MELQVGSLVRFDEKVFQPPYSPYYDAYQGDHTFMVLHESDNHYLLHCIDDNTIVVKGYVHDDEVVVTGKGLLGMVSRYLALYDYIPPRFENETGAYMRKP